MGANALAGDGVKVVDAHVISNYRKFVVFVLGTFCKCFEMSVCCHAHLPGDGIRQYVQYLDDDHETNVKV